MTFNGTSTYIVQSECPRGHPRRKRLPSAPARTFKKIAIIGTEGSQSDFVWKLCISSIATYGSLLEPESFTVVAISPGFVDTSATAVKKRQWTAPFRLCRWCTADDDLDMTANKEAWAEFAPKIAKLRNVKWNTPEQAAKRILSIVDSATPKDAARF